MSGRVVLTVVPDLFFATRIAAVAEATGARVVVASRLDAAELARREAPDLVVLDLHSTADLADLVRDLGDAATREIPIVGFYSHVDTALRDAALAAGVHHVMPRSLFTRRLPELLSGVGPA